MVLQLSDRQRDKNIGKQILTKPLDEDVQKDV